VRRGIRPFSRTHRHWFFTFSPLWFRAVCPPTVAYHETRWRLAFFAACSCLPLTLPTHVTYTARSLPFRLPRAHARCAGCYRHTPPSALAPPCAGATLPGIRTTFLGSVPLGGLFLPGLPVSLFCRALPTGTVGAGADGWRDVAAERRRLLAADRAYSRLFSTWPSLLSVLFTCYFLPTLLF